MGTEGQKHKLLKTLLVTFAGILLTAGTGFGVWYWQQNEMKKQKSDSNKQIQALEKQIKELGSNSSNANSEETTKTEDNTPTNDQIFQEVSTQLGFTRSQLSSLKIHKDKDRVQYRGTEVRDSVWGTHYTYKEGSTWKKVPGDSGLSISSCSALNTVPEKYRTGCTDESGQSLYMNSQNEFINYLLLDMQSYIGE